MVTRSVRDTAALLDVVAGPEPGDPYTALAGHRPYVDELTSPVEPLRVAVWDGVPGAFGQLHPEVAAAVVATGRLLAGLGHVVEEGHPPVLDRRAPTAVLARIVFASTQWAVRRWERICGQACLDEQLEPITRHYLGEARRLSAADLLDLTESAQLIGRAVADWFAGGHDVLLTATCAEPPNRHGELQATTDEDVPRALAAMLPSLALTTWCNLTGVPAISLPLGWSADGLPLGIQLAAPHGREDLLVRLAAQLEQAAPWADRHPGTAGQPAP